MHQKTGGSVKSPIEPLSQSPPPQLRPEKIRKPPALSSASSHGKDPFEDRLDSWKVIANYLNREVRTVQRWEKEEGLPVRRHPHIKASSVYGFKTEIDQWRKTRSLAARWAAESESTSRVAHTPGQLERLILSLASEIIVAQESRSCEDEPLPVLILYCFPIKLVFFVSFRFTSTDDSSENVPSAIEGNKSRCHFPHGGEKCTI